MLLQDLIGRMKMLGISDITVRRIMEVLVDMQNSQLLSHVCFYSNLLIQKDKKYMDF